MHRDQCTASHKQHTGYAESEQCLAWRLLVLGLLLDLRLWLIALWRLRILRWWLTSRQLFHWQPIQWTGHAVQMLSATVQVDHRGCKARMPQQSTDGQQIHARFE